MHYTCNTNSDNTVILTQCTSLYCQSNLACAGFDAQQ